MAREVQHWQWQGRQALADRDSLVPVRSILSEYLPGEVLPIIMPNPLQWILWPAGHLAMNSSLAYQQRLCLLLTSPQSASHGTASGRQQPYWPVEHERFSA